VAGLDSCPLWSRSVLVFSDVSEAPGDCYRHCQVPVRPVLSWDQSSEANQWGRLGSEFCMAKAMMKP